MWMTLRLSVSWSRSSSLNGFERFLSRAPSLRRPWRSQARVSTLRSTFREVRSSPMTEVQSRERRVLDALQKRYEARGFSFFKYPSRELVPEFLGDYTP